MHADLVIDIGFEHGEGGSEPTKVWGTAIRFKERSFGSVPFAAAARS